MESNSATFQNILMVLSRIIEQVNMECHIQEWQLCWSLLSSYDHYFLFISELYLGNHLKYFNDTLKHYTLKRIKKRYIKN